MLRSQVRASVAYAVGNIARSGALFLLTPYLVNRLSADEYGAWVIFEVSILLVNMLMEGGLTVGLMRGYWFLEGDVERSRLLGTIAAAIAGWGGVLGGLGVAASGVGLLDSLPGGLVPLVLVLGSAWADSVLSVFLALFRIREEVLSFVVFSVGREVLFLFVATAMIQSGLGVNGGLAGRCITGGLAIVVALVAVSRRNLISFRIDWSGLGGAVRYGLPILPSNLAAYVLFAADRYILQLYSSLGVVAVYSFSYKIATLVEALITRPFAADWAARRFKIATQAEPQRAYAQALLLYLYAALGFGLLLLAASPLAYRLLAPPLYREGLDVVPLLILSYIVLGLGNPLNVGIMLKDRTLYLPIIGFVTAAICIGLNCWWIPRFGMRGAAWATLVSYALWTGLLTWVSLRLYPIRYDRRRILACLTMAAAGFGILQVLQNHMDLGDTITSVMGLLVVSIMLLILLYPDRQMIWGVVVSFTDARKARQ